MTGSNVWEIYAKQNIHNAFLSLNIPLEENEFSQKLYQFFVTNIGASTTLTDAARYFSLDKYYFCRLCRKNTGYSYHSIATIVKMESAKALLKTTQLSINYVSDMLLFSSVHYFSKLFKNYAGTTPGRYRHA